MKFIYGFHKNHMARIECQVDVITEPDTMGGVVPVHAENSCILVGGKWLALDDFKKNGESLQEILTRRLIEGAISW